MIKIFRILLILLLSFFVINCDSDCALVKLFEVETVENVGKFTLTIDEDVIKYLNTNEIPSYTLTFDGTINSSKYNGGNFEIAFYNNDDFFISELVKKVIDEYTIKNRVSYKIISTDSDAQTWLNKKAGESSEKEYIKVKDNKITNEIAYISLENGLQLSINYARFSDFEGNVYYKWQKTEGIRFVLHYPLMVYYNEEKACNEVVVMPLPNGVIYYFDTTTKDIDSLIKNDKYLEEEYYEFGYVNSYEEDYESIINYYINDCNGKVNDDYVECEFMENKFKITFTEESFKIKLIN